MADNNKTAMTAERQARRLAFIRKDPQVNAVMEKLIAPVIQGSRDNRGNRSIGTPAEQISHRIIGDTAQNVSDARSIQQVLPDIKIVKNILVSSILSPNDMINTELNFQLTDHELDSEMTAPLLKIVSEYFKNDYKIEDKLPEMLEEILFDKGAYPQVILPESTIDDLINSPERVTMESLKLAAGMSPDGMLHSKGFLGGLDVDKTVPPLGQKVGFGFEAFTVKINRNGEEAAIVNIDNKPMVTVTDNPDALKLPMVKKNAINEAVSNLIFDDKNGANSTMADKVMEGILYKRRQYNLNPIVSVKGQTDLKRPTVGHPVVMKVPIEAVIPVHVPGNPSEHVGYFLALDPLGNPLNSAEYTDYYNELTTGNAQGTQMASQLIQRTRQAMMGQMTASDMDKAQLTMAYGEMIEADLTQRLKNGVYGDQVQIGDASQIYRMMLARAFMKMQTRLLYVPKNLMVYMAFDYNDFGVGKSLLEDTKVLAGIRAVLLFTDTVNRVKNSIGKTRVKIELDPEDPNPGRTVEFMLGEYDKMKQSKFPLNTTNPGDIVDYTQRAGVEVEVSGHEAYPVTAFETEDFTMNKTEINTEFTDGLRAQHHMAFGVPPEAVDDTNKTDFATTFVARNLMFAKRTMIYQKKFCLFLVQFARRYTLSSSILMDEMRKAIKDVESKIPEVAKGSANPIDYVIALFLASLEVTLPDPDLIKLESQMKAFDEYSQGLEKMIKSYLDAAFFDRNMVGDIADALEPTKAYILSVYQRKWLRDNNVMPELNDLVTFTEEDGPAMDLLEDFEAHMKGLQKNMGKFMTSVLKAKGISDDKLQAAGGVEPPENSGGDTAGTAIGGDDLGMGTDLDLDLDSDLDGGNDDLNGNPEADIDAETATGGPQGEEGTGEPKSPTDDTI